MSGACVPTIPQWLSDKTILISGGTGYIGKLLIEKLLRSCPQIKVIYYLVRSKKGKCLQERHDELLKSDLWSYSKFDYDFAKLVPIEMVMGERGMTLSAVDMALIQDSVNIIFHSAASVKFVEPIKNAILSNVRLTRDMLALAKGVKNLDIFVDISTAYSNSNRLYIEEKVYPPYMDWRKAITLAETANSDQLDAVTEAALGNFPNVYTLTKNMAEHVVWDHRHELPVLIFRPVIVISISKEPAPGWTDNISGPEMLAYGHGKGMLRITGLDCSVPSNICGGDLTVNSLIISTWKVACHSKVTGQPCGRVFNSPHMRYSMNDGFHAGVRCMEEEPLPDVIWREYLFQAPPHLFLPLHLLFNHLPGLFIQLAARFAGKNLPINKVMRALYVYMTILFAHFANNNFIVPFEECNKAIAAICDEDYKVFDTEQPTVTDIVRNFLRGTARNLNERNLTLEQKLRQRKIVLLIDAVCRVLLIVVVLYYFPYQWAVNAMKGMSNCFFEQFSEMGEGADAAIGS